MICGKTQAISENEGLTCNIDNDFAAFYLPHNFYFHLATKINGKLLILDFVEIKYSLFRNKRFVLNLMA